MALDEAIEILDRHYILHFDVPLADLNKASKLGIEALAYIQKERYSNFPHHIPLLRGETEK